MVPEAALVAASRTHAFRAMGTEVELVAPVSSDQGSFRRASRSVASEFEREERRCSRFRADSELSRVNARPGRWTRVSAPLAEVLRLALDAASETQGLFDPTVLPTLERLGYDRDFDEVLAGAREVLHPAEPCGRWAEVGVDGNRVRLPEGVRLDLGGIAKGWTADRAALAAIGQGLEWAVVNAGGDLRLAGDAPDGVGVDVEDPEAPGHSLGHLTLDRGAVATSSVTRRSWGPALHHLIDPRTGVPAASGVVQATAWAPTCAQAEVRSKVALLEGPAALDRVEGALVLEDGRIVTNLSIEPETEAAS